MQPHGLQLALQVSLRTIIVNVILAVFKLAAGLLGRSAAMLSDAVHTLSDVLSTIIVMIGVRMASKQADREHPYGHERFECVAAILLSLILAATGLGIGMDGLRTVFAGNYGAIAVPGLIALIAAIVSILVKEAMYWYTRAAARKLQSGALMADAWHHRSDALSSVGSLVGILGARLGFPVMDSLACLVICAFILRAAFHIFRDSVGKMTDRACDETTIEALRAVILARPEVRGIDLLNTRLFGDRIYVDVEVRMDASMRLRESHQLAHEVHDAIEDAFPKVKHCMVHVNPEEAGRED